MRSKSFGELACLKPISGTFHPHACIRGEHNFAEVLDEYEVVIDQQDALRPSGAVNRQVLEVNAMFMRKVLQAIEQKPAMAASGGDRRQQALACPFANGDGGYHEERGGLH